MKDGEVLSERYRVIRRIGRGGTSMVYQVEDRSLHKTWALKVFFDEAEYGEVFEREIRLLCRLNHPGLPRVVDVIQTREGQGILMDLLEGETLDHLKGRDGYTFPEKQVLQWGCQICDILEYLHHQDPPIIYGDLKPANLLLRPDGNIMLLDLGISRSMITPFYAAPEQLDKSRPLTPQTDLYGLGKTLAVLSGRRNAADKMSADELDGLIGQLTNADPLKRGKSAAEVRSSIQQILNGHFTLPKKSDRGKRSFLLKITVPLVLTISGLAVGTIHFKHIHHFNQKQKKIEAGNLRLQEAASVESAERDLSPESGKRKALQQNIAAILNEPSDKRDYKALAEHLNEWRQILVYKGDEGDQMTPRERYHRAQEERQCAEYYLTYEEELESKAQVPRTEAEGLLLDAEKRLAEVDPDGTGLSSEAISKEQSAVLSLLLNLYQRSNRAEQALGVVNKLLNPYDDSNSVEETGDDSEQGAEYSLKELHMTKLNLLLDLDRHDEAYREFNLLLKQYPKYLKSYLSMISYDYGTGRMDEAVKIYHLAEQHGDIANNPDFAVMRTKLQNAGAI